MIKTFTSKLLKKEKLAEDTYKLRFSCPPVFIFRAGQFINIRCTIGDESKFRSYSILNPPSEKNVLETIVKIVDGGFASNVFMDAKEGDEFEIKGPLGHFVFEPDTSEEYWFLCAGTGVVPFYSMLKEHISQCQDKKFVLLFGTRTRKHMFLIEEFSELSKKHKNLDFRTVLSREEWERTGRVHNHLPENIENKTFYICGLKELVLDTEKKLLEKGVEKQKIKKERYS